MIPEQACYSELETNVVDQWGIPVLRSMVCSGANHEIKPPRHATGKFAEMLNRMGAKKREAKSGANAIQRQEEIIHEVMHGAWARRRRKA